jgi:hypothetical protein
LKTIQRILIRPGKIFLPGRRLVRSSLCIWYCLAAGAVLLAQQPSGPGFTLPVPSPDSLSVFYVFADAPEERYPKDDTLPDARFRFYDPARQSVIDWGTLGNLGSSARPLWFSPAPRRGFDMGIHPFDLYRLTPDSLRFYKQSRTYSDVFFSQGRTQNDNMVRAVFSRTFGDSITFALDYRTFNNIGQYRYQTAKHSGVSAGIRWPLSRRYQVFLIFTSNSNRQQENGGIAADTLFGSGQFGGAISAPIRLPDQRAQTRIADRTIVGIQHFDFGNTGRRTFRARHKLGSSRQEFKFFNTNLQADSVFFDTFFVDRRGLRHYTQLYRLDNEVDLLAFRQKEAGASSDLISAGIAHSYFRLQQEPRDSAFSNLFLTGRFTLAPGKAFAFQARGAFGLLSNFGEYTAEARLKLSAGRFGRLELDFNSRRYPVAQLYRQLYVSDRLIWQNDFNKPVETSIAARFYLLKLGLTLSGQTHLVNNYLYFDQRGVAAQTGAPLQVAQLSGNLQLPLGPFRLDNTFALQQANRSDVLRLPGWFVKSSLYYAGALFAKKLELQAGFDFRINADFRPDAYQPLSWQFHLQDSITQQPYPWLDAFVAFRVQTFRFFFRYENLATLWDNTRVFYQTAYYAQPFGAIRLGIAWRFLDGNEPGSPTGGGGGGSRPPAGVGSGR